MKFSKELILLLKARYPILYISSFEEERVEYTINKVIKTYSNKSIYAWNFIDGYKSNVVNPKFAAKKSFTSIRIYRKYK